MVTSVCNEIVVSHSILIINKTNENISTNYCNYVFSNRKENKNKKVYKYKIKWIAFIRLTNVIKQIRLKLRFLNNDPIILRANYSYKQKVSHYITLIQYLFEI